MGNPPLVKTKRRNSNGAAKSPPPFQPPQLATLVDRVPTALEWVHEIKYDGYRTLLAVGGGQAKAYTRSGLDWSTKFSHIVLEAAGLPVTSALIDGEAVVMDDKGVSNFQALQKALKSNRQSVFYYAFDLLALDGEDLRALPLIERKKRLEALLPTTDGRTLLYSEHITGSGDKLLQTFCAAGLEGIISKRADSLYSGSRSGNWLKIKCTKRQEFLVVGWTPSDKARGFKSLLLGANDGGRLRYAGKVGTGFDTSEMARLVRLMKPLESSTPTVDAPRTVVRGAHWLQPPLVAEIAFAEITAEGVLRHPSYLGLREDKKPSAVFLETAKPVDEVKSPAGGIRISKRDRILYPENEVTKGSLADYYAAIAPAMLPLAGSRPISPVRCPQGRAKKCFFQKHDAGSFGDHVHQVAIAEKDGDEQPYLFIDDPEGLLTCVQMGTIEFHGWGARIEDVEKADRMVFDLDPDEGLDFDAVRKAAFYFRDLLKQINLVTYPMVTGGKGVHVIAPLTPQAEWPEIKDFARRLAGVVADSDPENFTVALYKAKRKGRIFIDYLRNQRGATAVMPYSVRARPAAPVAVPITWPELETVVGPARWHVTDGAELLTRSQSKALAGWGRADQTLPDITS
ncbi:DNA ligase D [Mesorhizobium loti]|uniref:DNA ligase D n=1 Tax=Rhizobium loti TaxID=381 RepID=UPI00040074C8|nr:DNA ligase D [Mesorhizobium loti]